MSQNTNKNENTLFNNNFAQNENQNNFKKK